MRALVTGGAGFIGGHLSARLLADRHHVICVDDLSTGNYSNIARAADDPAFEFVQGSVLDAQLMDELTARVDTVFHLAAAVGVRLIMGRPLEALRTNIHGTETVLDCAHRHGARTLIASTSEVYGKSTAELLHEDQDRLVGSPLIRRWSYAEAKAVDETLAYLFWCDLVAPTVIVRLFNIAGPRQTGRYGMVIPRFVDQAIRGEPLTVYGDGTQTRSFCHVDDAVDGLIALIDQPSAYGGAFNIGRAEEVSIQGLAERVIALTGSASVIKRVPYREAYGDGYEDVMRRVPDISRARNLVGFDPKLDLDHIIGSIVHDRLARSKSQGNGHVGQPAVRAGGLGAKRVR